MDAEAKGGGESGGAESIGVDEEATPVSVEGQSAPVTAGAEVEAEASATIEDVGSVIWNFGNMHLFTYLLSESRLYCSRDTICDKYK